jgi:PPP family 3-phenylpropionic acid transporter
MAAPMRAIKRQYLLIFAATGAFLPYLPVFLEQRLGDRAQVGDVLAMTGLGFIVTPVLVGFLADVYVSGRTLLAVLSTAAVAAAAALAFAQGFWPIAVAYALFALMFWPQSSLLDGFLFSVRQQRLAAGLAAEPFYRVRVWGTLGFILPAAGLYALMARGAAADVAILVAGAIAALGLVNAFSLPRTESETARAGKGGPGGERPGSGAPGRTRGRIPTLAAAQRIFRGPALVLCASMFLGHLALAVYYGFYPIYLTGQIGFSGEWVGLIVILGVVVELGVMMAVGALVRTLGMRGALVLGLGATAVRFAILALVPSPFWAVTTQALHGLTVIALHVLPAMYLDSLAEDAYRTSIQGLYTMLVIGVTRLVGSQLAGRLAEFSLLWLFGAAALAVLAAALLLLIGFREGAPARGQSNDRDGDPDGAPAGPVPPGASVP